jgi:hypothetical protein
MKKILAVALVLLSLVAFTQKMGNQTCYQKYIQVFDERGSEFINDGWHEGVIISIRKGINADCYYGKVRVWDNKVVVKDMFIKIEDGSYEQIKRTYRNEFPLHIANGVSRTLLSMMDEQINVLFINKLKTKKKNFVRAPDPSADL